MKRAIGLLLLVIAALPGCVAMPAEPAERANKFTPLQLSIWPDPQIQLAPVMDVYGLRLNLPYGKNFDFAGLDLGVINLASNNASGVQVGLLGNAIGETLNGLQIGAVGNSAGKVNGLQIGGLSNAGQVVDGIQLALLFNITSFCQTSFTDATVNGLQLALVNIAGQKGRLDCQMCGAQIGLVNYSAKSCGVQFGLLNFMDDGFLPFFPLVNLNLSRTGVPVTWQKTPAFARIAVSEKSIVYVQILNGELRAAMSVEGLQTAAPVRVRLTTPNTAVSSEFILPVPAEQLPARVTAIRAQMGLRQDRITAAAAPQHYVSAELTACRTDDKNAKWQYTWFESTPALAEGENAAHFTLLDPDNLKFSFQLTPSKGKLAIGLRILAGNHVLENILKDGQKAQLKVTVTNDGAETASEVGTLDDFGFS